MKTIGRYEIRQEIASGPMGQVCTAYDPMIQRLIAIKTIDRSAIAPEERDNTVARFKREAIAAGRLTHPGIITVFEYGEEGKTCYIAMELISGQTLRGYLTSHPLPGIDAVRSIARQLFAAMIYAHEQGVLHRDLKPSNILLLGESGDRATPQIKLVDFGIAKLHTEAGLTHKGAILGSPGYMSPEQVMGEPVDLRADIYAVGVILFELLTGRRPFNGDLPEVLNQVVNQDAPLLSTVRPGLPPALDAVIARALSRQASMRYAHMREFREACVNALLPERADAPAAVAPAVPAAPASADVTTLNLNFTDATTLRNAAPAAASTDAKTITEAPAAAAGTAPRAPGPALPRPALNLPSGMQLSAVASSLSPAAHQAVPRGERPKVLFLDDEERIVGALSALFRLKYEVLTSTEGAHALELVKTHKPHVIVSDQRMPGMLGIDFLRQAREIDPASVRILLTGYSDLAAITGSINDGEVFRFVNKPWSNNEIKETLAEAVAISLSTRQAVLAPAVEAPAATETSRSTEAILVAQGSREFFDLINHAFGRTRPVCHAADVAAVLQTLEDQEVAILVCDLDTFAGAPVMLKMLKQSHPQIQTLVVADSSDAEVLISLINQAQIFRFFNRPMRLGLLDRSLRSALDAFSNYKAKPVLLKRHAVEKKPEVAESSIGRQILQRLGFLLGAKQA